MLWLIPSGLECSRLNVEKNIDHIGQLLTPRTWHMNQLDEFPLKWGADNDCFTGRFNGQRFIVWLESTRRYQDRCLFVACPDVVADKEKTLEQFSEWQPIIRKLGYSPALVLQDGMTTDLPWSKFDAVFVGGTTEYKLSQDVIAILNKAGELGKWRHVGRINSINRMKHFWEYADSFDGTDYVFHPEGSVKANLPFLRGRKLQGSLFGGS